MLKKKGKNTFKRKKTQKQNFTLNYPFPSFLVLRVIGFPHRGHFITIDGAAIDISRREEKKISLSITYIIDSLRYKLSLM